MNINWSIRYHKKRPWKVYMTYNVDASLESTVGIICTAVW